MVVTVTDNTRASGTASFTWTVSAASTCTAPGQKITNPGFESGNTGRSASIKVIGQYAAAGEPARTGTWVARLDGYGKGCAATLSFYLRIDTAETTTTAQYDTFTVKAAPTVLGTFPNLNAAAGYAAHSYNMSSYAGQAVTLTFTGTENSSSRTPFVLDDTSLTAS